MVTNSPSAMSSETPSTAAKVWSLLGFLYSIRRLRIWIWVIPVSLSDGWCGGRRDASLPSASRLLRRLPLIVGIDERRIQITRLRPRFLVLAGHHADLPKDIHALVRGQTAVFVDLSDEVVVGAASIFLVDFDVLFQDLQRASLIGFRKPDTLH